MVDELDEIIEATEPCDDIAEYDNIIEEDDIEIEPEELDDYQETHDISTGKDDSERQFARFELNYRARRIRELTAAPIKKKDRRKPKALAA